MGPAADGHRAEESDGEHRQSHRHPQDEQHEQCDDAGEADPCVAHSALPIARPSSTSSGTLPRRASTNASTISTAAYRPTPTDSTL